MKKIYLIALALSLFAFVACEKDEEKAIILGDPTASTLGALPSLDVFDLDNTTRELTFTWTAADFGFQSATTYILQVDSATKNFANAGDVFSTEALTNTITVGDFNTALQDAGFEEYDEIHSMQARICAIIFGNSDTSAVYSEPVDFTVVPFATEFPPIYMTGWALNGWSWDPGVYVELRSSAPKVYSTIAKFNSDDNHGGGGDELSAFRFFEQTDWSPTSWSYPHFTGGVTTLLDNANDGDQNFHFVGANGYYEITADLKNLTVDMTAVPEPQLYMTGWAVGGWDWTTNFVEMTWVSNGVFTATTDFNSDDNHGGGGTDLSAFRFFAQADWGPTSYNFPYFAGGQISEHLADAGDGDNNFHFVGPNGTYEITVNFLDNIITMKEVTK